MKLVTRDGFIIRQVCVRPEKAIEVSLDAGYKYLLTSDSNRVASGREAPVKLLLDGKEIFRANRRAWSGDLLIVSRYVMVSDQAGTR